MRVKTQTYAIAVCFAIASIQLVSCKKDNAAISNRLSRSAINNAFTDSTSDSSLMIGLIAFYPFNGDVLDHSGNNNNVIFNSAKVGKGKAGLAKTAYFFDGVSSFMEVANSPTLNLPKISIYALVKPAGFYTGKCHDNRIICKGYNDFASGRIDLGFSDAAYYNFAGCDMPVKTKYENFFGSVGDGSNAAGARDFNNYVKTNQWYSVVYTFNGTTSTLYVNGVVVNKNTGSTTFNPDSDDLFIGKAEDVDFPYYFKGTIDEIRIYKRAITPKEVLQLYNNN